MVALATINQVGAHTSLKQSTPEDGATLNESPDVIILQFSQDVIPILIRLTSEDDIEKGDLGEPEADGATLRIPVGTVLQDGNYKINFRGASKDGHTKEGALTFSLESESPDE